MYAIVKTGGKQYKVAVGDVVEVEKIVGEPGAASTFRLCSWSTARTSPPTPTRWPRSR